MVLSRVAYFPPFYFAFIFVILSVRLTSPQLVVLCLIKCFNLLAYADDLVLLAPSWCSLQFLINLLVAETDAVGLSVNAKKTVTMIFVILMINGNVFVLIFHSSHCMAAI